MNTQRRVLALCSTITTFVLVLTVPATAHADPVSRSSIPSTSATVSCSAGGMTGEARLRYESDGGSWQTTVESYRITANGRKKANVNLYHQGHNLMGGLLLDEWAGSHDAMIQDGQWHTLGTGIYHSSIPWSRMGQDSTAGVEFVFDKSGSDPRCRAQRTTSSPSKSMSDLRQQVNVADRSSGLTSCQALSPGLTCSIAQTKTISSTVTVGLSSSPSAGALSWLTASLSNSWTSALAGDVRCTSPALTSGQRFVAYPEGTKSDFHVRVNAFGATVDGPGSAFEVNGGIACEVA